jgi:cell wall-associated NlpC family hydrolase
MKKPVVEIVGQYIGKPFKPGGRGDDGWGCIELCHAILTDMGKNPPNSVGDVSLDDYLDKTAYDVEQQHVLLLSVAHDLGREVPIDNLMPGDGIVIKTSRGGVGVALYLGQGKAITSTPGKGVIVFTIDDSNAILMARRFG